MRNHGIVGLAVVAGSLATLASAQKIDERAAIVETIEAYSKGTDERDVDEVRGALHENGHHYIPGPDGVRIVPTEVYLTMLGEGRIGGQERDIRIVSVDIESETAAAAVVELSAPQAVFKLHMALGKLADGWRILSVLAVVKPL